MPSSPGQNQLKHPNRQTLACSKHFMTLHIDSLSENESGHRDRQIPSVVRVGLLAVLTSQQCARVSQGSICSDKCTCCHTEMDVADKTFCLTQSQHADTRPTRLTTDHRPAFHSSFRRGSVRVESYLWLKHGAMRGVTVSKCAFLSLPIMLLCGFESHSSSLSTSSSSVSE